MKIVERGTFETLIAEISPLFLSTEKISVPFSGGFENFTNQSRRFLLLQIHLDHEIVGVFPILWRAFRFSTVSNKIEKSYPL